MAKFSNPLANVRVASPCPANWDEMIGDERRRFCGQCKLNVYNLSAMTRDEAEKLLINTEGRICVRFYRRADGTILTQDCPVGWAALKRKISRRASAVLSFFVGVFGGLGFNAAFNSEQNATMGTMPVPVVPITREIPVEQPTTGKVAVVKKPEATVGMISLDTKRVAEQVSVPRKNPPKDKR